MAVNVCYHHSNCLDKPAVGACSNCGKSLCAECVNKFRSSKTGKILCVDCFNAELEKLEHEAKQFEKLHNKQAKLLIWGGGLFGAIPILFGLAVAILSLIVVDFEQVLIGLFCVGVGVWFGSTVTSLKTICQFAGKIASYVEWFWLLNIVIKIVAFIVGVAISPIFFFIKLFNHIKDKEIFKKHAEFNKKAIEQNKEFLLKARSMCSGSFAPNVNSLINEIQDLKNKLAQEHQNNNIAQVQQLQLKIKGLEFAVSEQQSKLVDTTEKLETSTQEFEFFKEQFDRMSRNIG